MTVWAQIESLGNPEWVLKFDTHKRSVYSIGRHPSCSLILSDMHISSKHLSISQRVSPENLREVVVEDSSSNGTWIDGEKLERGVPVRLLSGSEIVLPCEDNERKRYTFSFKILQDLADVSSDSIEGVTPLEPAALNRVASPLSSEEATYAQREQHKSSAQWQELEKLQDVLIVETARLAATVYGNESTIFKLSSTVQEFESTLRPEGATLSVVEQALNDMQDTKSNLLNIMQTMLSSMRQTGDLISGHSTLADEDKAKLLASLDITRYEAVLDHLATPGADENTSTSS